MHVPGNTGADVLLVGSEGFVLLDGQELTPRWTPKAAHVLRYGVYPRSCAGAAPLPRTLGTSHWLVRRQPWGWGRRPCTAARASCLSLVLPRAPDFSSVSWAVVQMWPWETEGGPVPGCILHLSLLTETPRECFLHIVPENPSSATTNQTPWL